MTRRNFSAIGNHIDCIRTYLLKTHHSIMISLAICIGLLAGFGAFGLQFAIHTISDFFFPNGGNFLEAVTNAPWYVVLLVPALGGALVGPITYFFAREAKGHGVPEVMQAVLVKGGIIRPRVAIVKAITSAITIGTGGSVGREGPIIQIGASIGSGFGQLFKMSNRRIKTLVGCGAAAGIAAAFNTPIAGALFAAEIILQNFSFYQLSPIVIASVIATVVSHSLDGNFAAFQVPIYSMSSYYELIFYFALAVLCAIVAFIFMKVLYFSEDLFDDHFKIPPYLKPIVGGLLLGAAGIFFPRILGVGYESINQALHGDIAWKLALALLALKMFATPLTLGSGGSGGIFAPSLFLGAMTGAFFGGLAHYLFPTLVSTPGAYALVAMGGVVAAATHAPITAIIIVFEMTHDYKIILPLMITCMLSTLIATKFKRESIYTLKLVQRGVRIKEGGVDRNVMRSIRVGDVFRPVIDTLQVTDNFDKVVNLFVNSDQQMIPVVGNGSLKGVIRFDDIKSHLFEAQGEGALMGMLLAHDVANKSFKTVTAADHCDKVIEIMRGENAEGVPVVSSDSNKTLVGIVWRRDILDAYNIEVRNMELAGSIADTVTGDGEEELHVLENFSVAQITMPKPFVGKTIKELHVQQEFGVLVLLVCNRKNGKLEKRMPTVGYIFQSDDSLIVAGDRSSIKLVKNQ